MSTPATSRGPSPEPTGDVPPGLLDPAARVVLLGKPGCHLCDDARAVVASVCAEAGERFVERSTLDDVAWEMQYWEHIPVVFVDGERHAHWRVDADRLRAALARPAPQGPPSARRR